MCTAITYKTKDSYFGRTLDYHVSYNEEVGNGLIENEIDHVFIGKYNGKIELNLEETDEIMYISFSTLLDRINKEPEKYTIWFRMAAARVIDYLIKETEDDGTMH